MVVPCCEWECLYFHIKCLNSLGQLQFTASLIMIGFQLKETVKFSCVESESSLIEGLIDSAYRLRLSFVLIVCVRPPSARLISQFVSQTCFSLIYIVVELAEENLYILIFGWTTGMTMERGFFGSFQSLIFINFKRDPHRS